MDSATQEMVDAFNGKMLNYNVCLRQISNKNVTDGKIDMSMLVDKNEKFKKAIVISIGSECPKGDILVFAHDVAHRHSKAKDGSLWYAYYTFNNMNDPAFIEAGYPHPYTDWTKRDYSDEHA